MKKIRNAILAMIIIIYKCLEQLVQEVVNQYHKLIQKLTTKNVNGVSIHVNNALVLNFINVPLVFQVGFLMNSQENVKNVMIDVNFVLVKVTENVLNAKQVYLSLERYALKIV